MFTGIVEEIGQVLEKRINNEGALLRLGAARVLAPLKTGDSVAVNGVCLTVTRINGDSFTAWAMPETLERSNLKHIQPGHKVNLERALLFGDRIGGHLVSGHVDAAIALKDIQQQGGAQLLAFSPPPDLLRYIITKGSVALDGVSLTVVNVDQAGFTVGLIPHTAAETTLGEIKGDSLVNLEVDLLGKYIEKLFPGHSKAVEPAAETISIEMLRDKGYL